ncbi:GNAT family N-acetyltransferase [Oscillibacter sp.]|uniref:GNAT family N-acetyltransferase n=1 Tax=Oscillibacter sp. TaxID=1945593 RepID=UPI00339185D7
MEIRELAKEEYGAALDLAWEVFGEFEVPDYTPQGAQAFYASIHDPDYLARLRIYGAFEGNTLIGVLATRNGGAHIALFFVRGAYHRQGVGRRLFFRACQENSAGQMTVNSSPYAVEVYRRLGFCETGAKQTTDGIRYTPMLCVTQRTDCPCKRTRCARHGDCVACREHHKTDKKNTVYCQRPTREEKRLRRRRDS